MRGSSDGATGAAGSGEAAPDMVLKVQKYPNRRLYDRTTSRHLTHEQLHDLVASGRRVQVSDSRSGEDITNLVLAQVLLEHDPLKLAAFPSELFHLIIRTNHRLLPSVQRAILEATAALSGGWNGWRSLNERLPALASAAAASNPMVPAAAFAPPFASPLAWWLGGAATQAPAPLGDRATASGARPGDELASLRGELAELETRIAAMRSAMAPAARGASRGAAKGSTRPTGRGEASGNRAGRPHSR